MVAICATLGSFKKAMEIAFLCGDLWQAYLSVRQIFIAVFYVNVEALSYL